MILQTGFITDISKMITITNLSNNVRWPNKKHGRYIARVIIAFLEEPLNTRVPRAKIKFFSKEKRLLQNRSRT